MAFGKSDEEKAAEAAERQRQAEEAARAADAAKAARAQAAFLAGPIGQAQTAKQERQGFYEVQLVVGTSQRETSVFNVAGTTSGSNSSENHAGVLAAIESIGWKLEHVGYVFIVTGESTHERVFGAGANVAVSGETVGIYLFRNTDTA